jgi:hypothetical protein
LASELELQAHFGQQRVGRQNPTALCAMPCSSFAPSPNRAKAIALKIDDLPDPVGP